MVVDILQVSLVCVYAHSLKYRPLYSEKIPMLSDSTEQGGGGAPLRGVVPP